MKGATYVTVEADAAFVMPMNASGGDDNDLVFNKMDFQRNSERRMDVGWRSSGK